MRCAPLLVSVMFLLGCRAAAERAVLQPLPPDTPPRPYADLVSRGRLLAMTANEAYYIDNWSDLEDAARGLDQVAHFLKQSTEVPAAHVADLGPRTDKLSEEARQLREAAKARDVSRINSILQRIHQQIRELR